MPAPTQAAKECAIAWPPQVDAAYWMKGCSSLGLLSYAVLLQVGNGRDRAFCLMDIKEALAAAAPRYPNVIMPDTNGERIVEGARHLSPFLGRRIASAGRSVFIRELLPQDLKIEIEALTSDEEMKTARFMTTVVGRPHARQMSAQTRREWQNDL